MTEQEAIDLIKFVPLYRYECELEKGRQSELFEALNLAIKALEKQIPKKVDEFMERSEEFSSFYKLDFMCPSCLKATICQPYKPKYCKHCGQKLDWSDIE